MAREPTNPPYHPIELTSVSPRKLDELTRVLVDDADYAIRLLHTYNFSRDEIIVWISILDDAKDHQIQKAPKLWEYLTSCFGGALSVVALAFGFFSTNFRDVVVTTSLVVGFVSSALTIPGTVYVIAKDDAVMTRLIAIENAQETFRRAQNP